MKVIAWYLPQFHEIKENNEFWGKGFTEWTNMKKAKPLFTNHFQPRVPLNKNYYDLSDWRVLCNQASIAKRYGVYGFSIYHYWFDKRILLNKPLENLLSHTEIDINYCICWANESWTNSWVSNSKTVLIKQNYGDEKEWREHFEYLCQFFKDKRYIKEDGCPLLVIYRPEKTGIMERMVKLWKMMAVDAGFNGLKVAYQHAMFSTSSCDKSYFDYGIEYQPMYALNDLQSKSERLISALKERFSVIFQDIFGTSPSLKRSNVITYNYDKVWRAVLDRHGEEKESIIPGAFVDWDNTPRRGSKGTVFLGASPQKFEKYMIEQIRNARINYKSDLLFIFAWNEWAEGGYLEPDEKNEYSYLKALYRALETCDELP